jgi:hypothetical protein
MRPCGVRIALIYVGMKILRVSGEPDPESTLGRMPYTEVLEGDQEFLEAINLRLTIVASPRALLSSPPRQPGARKPPSIN